MYRIKNLTLFFFFWTFSLVAYSQKPDTTRLNYSPQARITLLTCAPGHALYASFGHTSIRVVDPVLRKDVVYNYGIFNFNTPNFYVKFARGMLKYMVLRYPTLYFLKEYRDGKRRVVEQELNLTPAEKKQFLDVLEDNYIDPEKRYYMYDFFYNNCASQIRDILKREFKPSFPMPEKDSTFREMLDVYIGNQPWIDLGIDLLLGLPADKKADVLNQMFLPDYLFHNMSTWKKADGTPLLGKPTNLVNGMSKIERPDPGFNQPTYMFWALFGIALLLTFLIRNNRIKRILDGFFLLITGFVGMFLLLMWVGTNHDATQMNLNIIWANPLYLYLAFSTWRNRKIKFTFGLMLLVTGALLASWTIFPQKFHFSLIPVFLLMIVRAADQLLLAKHAK